MKDQIHSEVSGKITNLLWTLIRVTNHSLVIAHYLMFNDGVFESNLAADTFRACKLIHICWPFLVSKQN